MLNKSTIIEVSRLISNNIGINIAVDKWNDIEHKITNACSELKITDHDTFINLLINSELTKEQLEILATHLTVGETYFYRETEAIDVFKSHLLPKLIEQRTNFNQTINIWSAGCCTGEEPYTLAMILNETLLDINNWNINIIATDINHHYLSKAKRGVYTQWSFRTTPDYIKNKYFTQNIGEYKIVDEIKKMVHFRKLNLVDVFEFPSESIKENSIDVLFCRNVLMYFTPEQIINVANRFYNCLVEGGWLITSPVEVSNESFNIYNYLSLNGTTVLEKNSTSNNNNKRFFNEDIKTTQKTSKRLDVINNKHKFQSKLTNNQKTPNTSTATTLNTNTISIENSTSKLLNESQKHFNRNNYAEAIKDLNELLTSEPNNDTAQSLLLRSLANLGNLTEALKKCKIYLSTNTHNASLNYLHATILLELNDSENAEQALRKAIYMDHSLVMAQFEMGNILNKRGEKKSAEKHYQNILNLLNTFEDKYIIPFTDNMTTKRMKEIINNFITK